MPIPDAIVSESIRDLTAYHTPPDPPAIKLDANEGPAVLTSEERARIATAIAELPLERYPSLRADALKGALASHLGARPEELVLGVGSDEVIGLLMRAFSRPRPGAAQASVLYPEPSFVMYPVTARVQGLVPVAVPLDPDRWTIDGPRMEEAIEAHRPNLIFLASPNNPTGNDFGDEALRRVIEAAPDALVVIDEAYAPFMGRTRRDWVDRHDNVAALGTLSKVGFAALRFGWVRLHRRLAAELEKVRPPYNLNGPSQRIARLVLEEMHGALDRTVELVTRERRRLLDALTQLEGAHVFDSDANFILLRVDDAASVHRGLLARGIAVRKFGQPQLAQHLRVTVGTEAENTAFLTALRAVL